MSSYSLVSPGTTDVQAVRWENAINFCTEELFPGKDWQDLNYAEQCQVKEAAFECLISIDAYLTSHPQIGE